MNCFVVLAALVACTLAVEQPKTRSVSSVSYGVPSGTVSFSSSVSGDVAQTYSKGVHSQGVVGQGVYGQGVYNQGVYGQGGYGQVKYDQVQSVVPQVYHTEVKNVDYVQPTFKQVQPAVKPVEYVQPVVRSVQHVVKPVEYAQPAYRQVHPVEYVQPAFKHVQTVAKPVEYVQPVHQVVNPVVYAQPAFKQYQSAVKPVDYVQPVFKQYQPAVKPVDYVQPVFKQYQPVVKPVDYVQPAFKHVQPVVKPVEYVQPVKRVDYVQPSVKYVQPVVKSVEPVVYRHAVPSFVQPHGEVSNHVPAILRMNQDASIDGHFNYGFESEDGITSVATGALKGVEGSQDPAQVMQGAYSYVAPDGTPVTTSWYADETGFHAEGAHLPVPPPVPEAIARSLEYLRSLPTNPEDLKYEQEDAKYH